MQSLVRSHSYIVFLTNVSTLREGIGKFSWNVGTEFLTCFVPCGCVCVCVSFLMCGCVFMCEFSNVWVCVCVCVFWQLCECFGNMCTCIYCVFVLFRLCTFILICCKCKDYCHRVKTRLQYIIMMIIIIMIILRCIKYYKVADPNYIVSETSYHAWLNHITKCINIT